MKRLALLAAAVVVAGCGSTSHNAQRTTHTRIAANCLKRPANAKQRHAYEHVTRILAEMRSAKTHDAESRLTDRFLLAEETSGLSAYVRNRLIDHAVAAATPKCQDCFQALEAERPIARPCSG